MRALHQRLNIVGLGVADVAAATDFYRRLGWSPSSVSNPHITFFQSGGAIVSLFGRRALMDEAGLDDAAGHGSAGATLACNMASKEEVDATLAEAAAAGGRISAPAVDRDWGGYSGYFTDLDGHAWEIAWNPYFEIAPDGTVTLPA